MPHVIEAISKPLWVEDLPTINVIEGIHEPYLEKYFKRIKSGEVLAGKRQLAAIERFHRDLKRFPYDGREVDRVFSFFCNTLKHSTGIYAGTQFVLRPWQVFVIANIFGFREKGIRRFRDAHICLGRGNGKSPLAAGIAIYLAFYDRESRASVYCAATKRDQAKVVFDECSRFVSGSNLAGSLAVRVSQILSGSGSSVEPMSSDRNNDGLIPHGLILDELHAWRSNFRDRYDKLLTGMGKRQQPLQIAITTAGDDLSEIWLDHLKESDRALDPVNDGKCDHHFAFICDIDADLPVTEPKNWVMSNPMLQDPESPVQTKYLEILAEKAKSDALAMNQFRRYHANQVVASTSHWLSPGQWDKGSQWVEPEPGQIAYGGFDLARTNDFAAIALVFPHDQGYSVESWSWTVKKRSKALKTAEFRRLIKCQHLTIHEGDQIDFSDIRAKMEDLSEQYAVQCWAYDPSWARETAQLMETAGHEVEPMPQSAATYNEPLIRLRDVLLAGGLYHGQEPLLTWQASNLMCKLNTAGLSQPDRRDTEHKIDGIVSVLMAFRLSLLSEGTPLERYYDDNDLESF